MRVLLIDDHALFRFGVSELLERRGILDFREGLRKWSRFHSRDKGAALHDRMVYIAFSRRGWMVPNQYWVPGVLAPMAIMGKYYMYYGYDFLPPRMLGRRCAERMKAELIMDNLGVCRFHRSWAEEMLPEIMGSLHNAKEQFLAAISVTASRINSRNSSVHWESERNADFVLAFLQVQPERLVEILHPHRPLHPVHALLDPPERRLLLQIQLVVDLPHKLFQEVLDGGDAGHAAVLVHRHRHLIVGGLQLAEKRAHRLGGAGQDRFPRQRRGAVALLLLVAAGTVAVEDRLQENRKRNRQSRRGAKYLLQGLVVCARCDYSFYGKPVSLKAAKGKRRNYAYYRCIGNDAGHCGGQRLCWNRPVREDRLDEVMNRTHRRCWARHCRPGNRPAGHWISVAAPALTRCGWPNAATA